MKRRAFLLGATAVAGGMAVGYRYLDRLDGNPLRRELGKGQSALTPYVIIDGQGVTIITPRAEMGQGVHTTLAALVAEELDVAMAKVQVAPGPASDVYANTVAFPSLESHGRLENLQRFMSPATSWRGTQLTGGQSSTQDGFIKMRKAGAAARQALLQAAAQSLDVDVQTLRTDDGHVIGAAGQAIPYRDLAASAATLDLPQDPPLREHTQWKILGRSVPRVDMPAKCCGTAQYAIDVRQPGMLFATVRRNPRLGGRMLGHDATAAQRMPGVIRIIPIDTGVIVVATNTWYAIEASRAVQFDWEQAPYPDTTRQHHDALALALDAEPFTLSRDDGDVDAALAQSQTFDGEYVAPYLAHATMEPLNAVARLLDGRLDLWAGTQNPSMAAIVSARIAGIEPDAVRVHSMFLGGGFGRRLEMDFIDTAVRAAVAMPGRAVNVTWTREEDMSHGAYRPMAMARFRASVADGRPVALDLRVASPSLLGSARRRTNKDNEVVADKFMVAGAADQPYAIDHYRVTAYRPPDLLPVGWWRSVGESQNSFFHESVIDELAHAAGVDPLSMRLDLLHDDASRAVLESVAKMSNWGARLPAGQARGVAFVLSSGAPTAAVIELRADAMGIRIQRAFVAIDVGIALDPRNIEAQAEGSLLFGLGAAIKGEITLNDGAVEQRNFNDYELLRITEVPPVKVHIHQSGEHVFGAGESATAVAAPALGNAIFAVTGRRIRELPFARQLTFVRPGVSNSARANKALILE